MVDETSEALPQTSAVFEKTLKELETVVGELESPEVGLDRSVDLYRRGKELIAAAEKMLVLAEESVAKIAAPSTANEGAQTVDR